MVARGEYPSQRAHYRGRAVPDFPANAEEWLADKRARDCQSGGCPSHLWLIHNKLYDLAPYLHTHPGGPTWLELTRGTDCTVAFETHHLNDAKMKPLLDKFFVRDVEPQFKDAVACYDWPADGFYATLKPKVHAHLATVGGPGPTLRMHVYSALALMAWLWLFAQLVRGGGSLAVAVLAGIAEYWLMGVGHNFFHQHNSPWRYVFDLTPFSSHNWRISHALSHHAFPNLDLDFEATMAEPFLFFMRNAPTNPRVLVPVVFVLVNVLGPVVEQLGRLAAIARGKEVFRWEHVLPVVQLAVLAASASSLGTAFACWLCMHAVALFLLVASSTPIHRGTFAWTEGCQGGGTRASGFGPELEYGRHTVIATSAYQAATTSLFLRVFLFGSFNDHVTHHLFPTVDLSKQHHVRALFLEHCRAHGVPYTDHTFTALFRALWEVLLRRADDLCFKPRPRNMVPAQ